MWDIDAMVLTQLLQERAPLLRPGSAVSAKETLGSAGQLRFAASVNVDAKSLAKAGNTTAIGPVDPDGIALCGGSDLEGEHFGIWPAGLGLR